VLLLVLQRRIVVHNTHTQNLQYKVYAQNKSIRSTKKNYYSLLFDVGFYVQSCVLFLSVLVNEFVYIKSSLIDKICIYAFVSFCNCRSLLRKHMNRIQKATPKIPSPCTTSTITTPSFTATLLDPIIVLVDPHCHCRPPRVSSNTPLQSICGMSNT
jgi:hypothetical protein